MKNKNLKNGMLMLLVSGVFASSALFSAEQAAGLMSKWLTRAKEQVQKLTEPVFNPEDQEIYEMHVLGITNKKVENPRTDVVERMKDKDFPGVVNNNNGDNSSDNFPELNNDSYGQNIESEILANILQISMKYNKHIFFFCVATGTLLAVIFPQQTKSMIHGTGSKIKRFFQKIGQCCSYNINKREEIKESSNNA